LPLLASRLKNLLRSNSIWNASLHSFSAEPAAGFSCVFLGFSLRFPRGAGCFPGHCVPAQPAIHLRAPKVFHFQLPDADASCLIRGSSIFQISLAAAACFSLPMPFGLRCFALLASPVSPRKTPSRRSISCPFVFNLPASPHRRCCFPSAYEQVRPLSPGNLPSTQYANNCVFIFGSILCEYFNCAGRGQVYTERMLLCCSTKNFPFKVTAGCFLWESWLLHKASLYTPAVKRLDFRSQELHALIWSFNMVYIIYCQVTR